MLVYQRVNHHFPMGFDITGFTVPRRPDVVTCNSSLWCCERGSRWRDAVQLLLDSEANVRGFWAKAGFKKGKSRGDLVL